MEEITPTVFETVYQYSGPTMLSYSFPAMGLLFCVIGLFMLAFNRKGGKMVRVFSACFFLFALLFTAATAISLFKTHSHIVQAIGDRKLREVTGPVEEFKPMPYEGHQMESFTVEDVSFEYSDYVETGGFNKTQSHGGPIDEGTTVRITYFHNKTIDQNIIVKVDLVKNGGA